MYGLIIFDMSASNYYLCTMFNIFAKRQKESDKLFFTTDIHCHIIPGVDDGAQTADKSLALLQRMESWGLERVIVTPHVTEDTFENTPRTLAEPFKILLETARDNNIGIKLSHSAEYRIDDFFIRQVEAGILMPYPNKYLLVENSFVQEAWNLDKTLFDLQLKGWKTILAHPERYSYYFDKKERYQRLHQSGTLFQINILSLAGYYGKEEKKTAEWLIDNDLVDLVGTDLHHTRHADAIDAYLATKDYRRHASLLAPRIKNDTLFV